MKQICLKNKCDNSCHNYSKCFKCKHDYIAITYENGSILYKCNKCHNYKRKFIEVRCQR